MTITLPLTACAFNATASFYMASLALSALFSGRVPSGVVLGIAAVANFGAALWMGSKFARAIAPVEVMS